MSDQAGRETVHGNRAPEPGREATPTAAYEALVQVGRKALREAGAGLNSTYEEDTRTVLEAVLPLVADALCIDWTPPNAEQGPCLCPPFSCECDEVTPVAKGDEVSS